MFIIYTSPKNGTHLLKQAIAALVAPNLNMYTDEIYSLIPMYNKKTPIDEEQVIFSTHPSHYDYDYMEKYNGQRLMLNMYRNPLDVTISRYFFYVKYRDMDTPFGEYFDENFLSTADAIVAHAHYVEQHSGLNFQYESCLENKAKFLEILAELFSLDREEINFEAVAEAISIDKAKQSEEENGLFKVSEDQMGPFYRDGTINQYKKYFDTEMVHEIGNLIPGPLRMALMKLGYSFEG
ncbi:sulfotransferase domain-containing protein [Temperatibacter marinus]|uniref:Sulfotransferase domain-containing protein n=1 Tax=Temperatibacter marinus TaxID=1456591 RepID=A0AA52EF43_9PROT|nr:sulfotransferase domain-containing protein [Temperatibacter marinus]WND02503.1 sulfotransferase domain-containing protein [Temperatibacter marinus]